MGKVLFIIGGFFSFLLLMFAMPIIKNSTDNVTATGNFTPWTGSEELINAYPFIAIMVIIAIIIAGVYVKKRRG